MVAWCGLGLGNVWLSLLFHSVVFGAIISQEVFQLRPLCLIPYLTRVRQAVGAAEQAFGYPVFSFSSRDSSMYRLPGPAVASLLMALHLHHQ